MTHEWNDLDERYFEWLYDQVNPDDDRGPSRSYLLLCETMHRTPFEWFVSRDENRAEYGRDLRDVFLDECNLDADYDWLNLDCSIFELVIALANAAEFQSELSANEWFWIMVRNIDLDRYTDDVYNESIHSSVVALLHRVIHRKYQANGRGGFFPLRKPDGDQRKVELWYQLSAYLLENFEV